MLALTRRAGERVYLGRGGESLRLEVVEARRKFAVVEVYDWQAGTTEEAVLVVNTWRGLGEWGRVQYRRTQGGGRGGLPKLLLDCPEGVTILRGELLGRPAP